MICALKETGVLPVITSNEIDHWQRIVTIAYRNNIRVIEFTHPRDSRSLNLFLHLLESCEAYPGLKIGVGTVLNTTAAIKYLQAGASFIASPFLYQDMAEACASYNAMWIPGCTSKEEVYKAQELGAKIVSLLPAHDPLLKSLPSFSDHFPDLHFIPSNGSYSSQNNMFQWVKAGALCIRTVLPILPRESMAGTHWPTVEQHLFTTIASIKNIRYASTVTPTPVSIL